MGFAVIGKVVAVVPVTGVGASDGGCAVELTPVAVIVKGCPINESNDGFVVSVASRLA